ncbi:MAG: hypothetical protein AB7P31_15160 [Steroidobacteraceae bacterium]
MDEKGAQRLSGGSKPRLVSHALGAIRAVVILAGACCLVFVNGALASGPSPSRSVPDERRVEAQLGGGLRADAAGKDGQLLGDRIDGGVELAAFVSANGDTAGHVREEEPTNERREWDEQWAFNQLAEHVFLPCLFLALGWLCAKALVHQGEEREWWRAQREWRKKWCEENGKPFVE